VIDFASVAQEPIFSTYLIPHEIPAPIPATRAASKKKNMAHPTVLKPPPVTNAFL